MSAQSEGRLIEAVHMHLDTLHETGPWTPSADELATLTAWEAPDGTR